MNKALIAGLISMLASTGTIEQSTDMTSLLIGGLVAVVGVGFLLVGMSQISK